MNKKSLIFLVFILTAIVSCNSKEDKSDFKVVTYHAVHENDTAILTININDKRFFGRYEVFYNKIGKDSGNVRGDIKGDTLRGDFHYLSNGGSWKRIPLALLKKENKLHLGSGVIATYLNLPCFMPGIPIEYDNAKFVFTEVK